MLRARHLWELLLITVICGAPALSLSLPSLLGSSDESCDVASQPNDDPTIDDAQPSRSVTIVATSLTKDDPQRPKLITIARVSIGFLMLVIAVVAARQASSTPMDYLLLPSTVIAVGVILAGDTLDRLRCAAEITTRLGIELSRSSKRAAVDANEAATRARSARRDAIAASETARTAASHADNSRWLSMWSAGSAANAQLAAQQAQDDLRTIKFQTQFDVTDTDGQESRNELFRMTVFPGNHGKWSRRGGIGRDRAALVGVGFLDAKVLAIPGTIDGGTACEVLYYSQTAWDQAMCVQTVLRRVGWSGWRSTTGGGPRLVHNPERANELQLMLSGCTPPKDGGPPVKISKTACSMEELVKAAEEFRKSSPHLVD